MDTPAQAAVASAMAAYVARNNIRLDAVLLPGDNFCVDLDDGMNDRHWEKLFERMYDPNRLAVPFYAVLGNHDHDDNRAQIELDYAKRNPHKTYKIERQDRAKFARSEHGFVHLQFTADGARVSSVNQHGKTLHLLERNRKTEVKVVIGTR